MSQVNAEVPAGPDHQIESSEVKVNCATPNVMTDLTRVVYEQQNVRQEIRDALERFNYQPMSRADFGSLAGMQPEEMKYLDLFWDPAFNKGWLYLSDEMIKSQLTNEKGKDALQHFYKRVLLTSDYIPDVDYKQVRYNDPLVVLGENLVSPSMANTYKITPSNRKLYYAVSGETYIDLLTKASTEGGKLARTTFRKVANAARLMFEYINVMHAILARKQIEEANQLLAEAEKKMIKLEAEKRGLKEYPDEWFYLATCDIMARSRAYKFGIITKSNTPEKRLSAYECGYTDNISLDYVYKAQTKCAKAIESAFRAIVSKYLKEPRTDIVLLSFLECKRIADSLVSATNVGMTSLTNMEKNFPALNTEPAPIYILPTPEVKGVIIAKPPIPPCEKCGKVYVMNHYRELHVKSCTGAAKTRAVAVQKTNVASLIGQFNALSLKAA